MLSTAELLKVLLENPSYSFIYTWQILTTFTRHFTHSCRHSIQILPAHTGIIDDYLPLLWTLAESHPFPFPEIFLTNSVYSCGHYWLTPVDTSYKYHMLQQSLLTLFAYLCRHTWQSLPLPYTFSYSWPLPSPFLQIFFKELILEQSQPLKILSS